jgi:hypothetical protein
MMKDLANSRAALVSASPIPRDRTSRGRPRDLNDTDQILRADPVLFDSSSASADTAA